MAGVVLAVSIATGVLVAIVTIIGMTVFFRAGIMLDDQDSCESDGCEFIS